ncbi:MAG: glutamate 5-kinase [Pseudomonadota bacterium]
MAAERDKNSAGGGLNATPPDASPFDARARWSSVRRVVVKIGSSLVVDHASSRPRATWLNALADDVAALKHADRDVIIVSSGAIALGRGLLDLTHDSLTLEESQAAAAVGQISLAHAYRTVMADRGLTAAQILLTLNDTEERRRYLNARGTIDVLLGRKVVPVVNENDTIATSEIRYGDNDRLSARVASMASADCLVLLSDVDGLYTAAPEHDPTAQHIPVVREITPGVAAMASGAASVRSRGGMVTKLEAARIAMAAGTSMVIADGRPLHPLKRLADGDRATWFVAQTDPVAARKKWIGGQLAPSGRLTIDPGAADALAHGKSLLPAGVTGVDGAFERGDCVCVVTADGCELARGLVAYSANDAKRIIGRRSGEVAAILGYTGRAALIHRDDMVTHRTASS